MMAGSALRRLMAEYKQLTVNPPDGIIAGPINEENFFEWEALIAGPEGTCFEGGIFPAKLIFPPDYPLSPPKMQFICEMFHPNSGGKQHLSPIALEGVELETIKETEYLGVVLDSTLTFSPLIKEQCTKAKIALMQCKRAVCWVYADGRVCISILHAPGDDPTGYECSAERWSPVQSVEKILLSVVSMLAEPNDESGANVDAAKLWREDREKFNKITERLVRKTLGLPPPE